MNCGSKMYHWNDIWSSRAPETDPPWKCSARPSWQGLVLPHTWTLVRLVGILFLINNVLLRGFTPWKWLFQAQYICLSHTVEWKNICIWNKRSCWSFAAFPSQHTGVSKTNCWCRCSWRTATREWFTEGFLCLLLFLHPLPRKTNPL